jgi:putative ABC transport system substrate-binding protein
LPGAAALAILADHGNPSSPLAVRETQAAAQASGIAVKDYWIECADQFGTALSAMKTDRIGGFVIAPGALFFAQRKSLADRALEHRLPSMAVRRDYAEAGCLMAYGSPIRDNYRQAADYVAEILRGVKPAELAVAQPTEFDFVINLKSATALGLVLPQALLARAGKV